MTNCNHSFVDLDGNWYGFYKCTKCEWVANDLKVLEYYKEKYEELRGVEV